jgi:glycosyltransferase involved in cell wall biosynthesis
MPGKVCIITTVHQPFDTRIFHKEAKTLEKAGYEVTLIAQHDKNEVVDNISIVALPKSKNRLSRMFLLGWKAYKLALKEKADIYHFHDPEFLPWAYKLKKKTEAKMIYDVHEDYTSSIKQKQYLPFFIRTGLSIIFDRVEKLFSKNMNIILAEKYYKKRFPEGKTILNYSLFLNGFKKIDKNYLDQTTNNKLIYTGSISEARGALIYAKLVDLIPEVDVFIIGPCNKLLLEKMYKIAGSAHNRLHIVNTKSFKKISSFYLKGEWIAGLAIFPYSEHYYQKELTKFFEYMNAGIPIIASNYDTWEKIIEGNDCGFCVNPDNLEEIRGAINYLINNNDQRRIKGMNGIKAFKEKYNWEIEGNKLVKLYNNLLSH